MKKTIICNIPMKECVDECIYMSKDSSLLVADRAVRYPVSAFLEAILQDKDELKVIMLVKEAALSASDLNCERFEKELKTAVGNRNVLIDSIVVNTAFSEEKEVHEELMSRIVDEIVPGSQIIVDMTYGPKDLPIVVFSALNFAEKFLECEISNILYGQALFANGHPVNTQICDMVPLFYLNSITNTIHADSPEKAKRMLRALISL